VSLAEHEGELSRAEGALAFLFLALGEVVQEGSLGRLAISPHEFDELNIPFEQPGRPLGLRTDNRVLLQIDWAAGPHKHEKY